MPRTRRAAPRDGEPVVDATLGRALAHRFDGDARRMAHANRLLVLPSEGLRPRTLLYEPPPFPGGTGAAVLPSGAPQHVTDAMLAVAVGLHLDGTLHPTAYADGELVGPTMPRHRAAVAFARAFLRAAGALSAASSGKVATRTMWRAG